ncbi:hypothetical protein CVT91_04710 [Candidatus Atribacteria bacterium HGW-Atribacteria-1]|nr:MAG: hypothetical protein CVT91_04710 [Candidatus Atribacteria bacterium HGW-Atribacteria-1]
MNKTDENLPTVSIIVVNWNGEKWLRHCFESLENINYPKDNYEVIIVDNTSSDDSVEFTRKNFPWIKILKLDRNYGYAGGNNKGAKIAKGEYILFLNNDTRVDENWLIEIVKPFIEDKTIKICGSREKPYDNSKFPLYTTYITLTGCPLIKEWMGYINKWYYEACAKGSSLMIKKKLFDDIGGFDESYFMYSEETDLCWRAWLMGFKTVNVPSSVYYHKGCGDSHSLITQEKFCMHITKNHLINILKNFEFHNLIYALLISFFYNSFQIFKYLLLRRPHSIADIIKAHLFVIRNLPKILKNRKIIQKNRKISDKELYKMGLILPLSKSIKKEINLSKKEYNGI